MMRDLDDDDVLPYARPLDLALILDGHDPDGLEDDANEQDGHECAQDGAGDGERAEDEADDPDPENGSEQGVREPWQVQLAERDAAGEWRLVGEPLRDATLGKMGLAHPFAENRNKRDFGQKFDWLANPARAWIAVRAGQLGVVRVNQPGEGARRLAQRAESSTDSLWNILMWLSTLMRAVSSAISTLLKMVASCGSPQIGQLAVNQRSLPI